MAAFRRSLTPAAFSAAASAAKSQRHADLGDREIVLGLQVDPHLSGSAKISGEPQGRVPGDPALAFDDSANPIGRHAQSHCEGIRRQAGLVQQVLQHFAGMDRREPLFSCGDHLNAS